MNSRVLMKDIGIRKITPRKLEEMVEKVKELSQDRCFSDIQRVNLYNVISGIGDCIDEGEKKGSGTGFAKTEHQKVIPENQVESPDFSKLPNVLRWPYRGQAILNSMKRMVFGSGLQSRYRNMCVRILEDYYVIPQDRVFSVKRISANSIVENRGWNYFYDEESGNSIAFMTLNGEELKVHEDSRKFLNCLVVYVNGNRDKKIAIPFTRFCNFTYTDKVEPERQD